jgi:fibronectin type 3 domain-containing protein
MIKSGSELTSNRRMIDKYKSVFDNVNIDFNNKVTVSVQFTPDVAMNSSILRTVYGA